MTDLTATLAERGARYGKFEDHAVIAQGLKDQMWATEGWSRLAPDQRQALEVIQDKVARILNGDPDYVDNWHDIAGYSRLVEDRLNERAAAMAKWEEPVSGFAKSSAQQVDAAGWIEWTGGTCPVPAGTLVDVKHRSGHVFHHNTALRYYIEDQRDGHALDWAHSDVPGDIVAYRVSWIDWHGGECPVPANALVDVRFRGGVTDERSRAGAWKWDTNYGDYGIIAYRLSGAQDR